MRWFKHVLLALALGVLVTPATPHGAVSHAEASPITEAATIAEASDGNTAEEQVVKEWYGYWNDMWNDCDGLCDWFPGNPDCDCVVIFIKI